MNIFQPLEILFGSFFVIFFSIIISVLFSSVLAQLLQESIRFEPGQHQIGKTGKGNSVSHRATVSPHHGSFLFPLGSVDASTLKQHRCVCVCLQGMEADHMSLRVNKKGI